MRYLLGIDIGTSGTKSVLFDEYGTAIANSEEAYPLFQPQNGWAEQDPEDWWNAVKNTVKSVLVKSKLAPSEICGIGLSGQMHGLVMLGQDGKVLRRSIIWCDQRTSMECQEITALIGAKRLIEITANPALTGFTASKILWVRNHEPKIFHDCVHILLPKDYIRYKLTGEYATDVSDASGMQLLDIPKRCWSDEILQKLGLDKELFGRLYESPEITGRISKNAAQQTGLMEGTIVVGGAGDNAAAAVGTGVVRDGMAFTTIGTSGVVYAHTSRLKIDEKGRVHTFCSAVPGEWHVMGVTQGAGLSLKWFRDQFCYEEKVQEKVEGISVYDLMTAQANQVSIGADRLLYLPYLMGERTPHLNPDCRGVFFGISAIHTRAHFIRAVLEGVGYSLRDCVDVLEDMNLKMSSMMACGGGARSDLWRQMLADLYQCPVNTVSSQEGAALGAAILAGVGAGVYDSVEAGCQSLIKLNDTSKPNLENAKRYIEFHNLYKGLYSALNSSFKALGKL